VDPTLLDDLASRLEARAPALSLRCTNAMYLDPFWRARFGGRGRRHADEDSAFHVQYVVASLRSDDAGIFRGYAGWLRGVLAPRGMCSWHLAESFRQLTVAIRDEAIEGARPACAILADGVRSLAYASGDAGVFEARSEAIATRARRVLGSDAYRVDELLSFVGDTIDRGDDRSLASHLDFLRVVLAGAAGAGAALERTVGAIAAAAAAELPGPLGDRVRGLVSRAPCSVSA